MYHLFLICPKGCINCNTLLAPMFNHHLLLPHGVWIPKMKDIFCLVRAPSTSTLVS